MYSQKPMNFITDPRNQELLRSPLFDSLYKTTKNAPKDMGLLCLGRPQMAQ